MEDKRRDEFRMRLRFLEQEARYESQRARSAILQHQLKSLRRRVSALETDDLDPATFLELDDIKEELGRLQALTNQQKEELRKQKNLLRKLRRAFRR